MDIRLQRNRLNWTFMELKYIKDGFFDVVTQSLNWTFMELKYVKMNAQLKVMGVWIEPLWNWNFVNVKIIAAVSGFELNLYGIEMQERETMQWDLLTFELNLYGIEIRRWQVICLPQNVWIEPLWNWNVVGYFNFEITVSFELKKASLRAYRVDNLRPNSLVVKGVVKKAGSGLATPMMTAEQKEWWKKTVDKKTTDTSNVKEVLSPKDKAIADLMNWFAQNVPQKTIGKMPAKRFEVTSTDNKQIIINKKFYNEIISTYKSDELYIEKLQYAQKAHEYIRKAVPKEPEPGRHHKEGFRVYVYEDVKYDIEFKVKEGQDGDFLYIMRLYKKNRQIPHRL